MDIELIVRAQSGDRDAMDAVLRDVRPLIVKRCARLLPYPQDAEEAAQDALLSVALKLGSYRAAGSFEGWVSAIATNHARMSYRAMKKHFAESHQSQYAETIDPARTSVIAGSRVDLLEALEALEARHPETLDAFLLRDFGGVTYDEVAVLTGAPLGTVKARIHTARGFLRKKLGTVDNFSPIARI